MSGGEPYDPARFTVAHPTLALGTIILITNTANGRTTFAEVADRMPVGTGRILEVSAAVAGVISLTDRPVAIRIIDLPR
jgi:rare lipoprotein A